MITTSHTNPKAAIIIIGNEILSGQTLDLNTQHIALSLGKIGVDLVETRTIADDQNMIVKTIHELSPKYDYIFTTGGIGPTHDDITAESVAAAFNVKYIKSEEICSVLKKHYEARGEEITHAREKMAYIPEGAGLLYNEATPAPGFFIKNVFSFAGIPHIMQSMLKAAIPMLKQGKAVKSESIEVMLGESIIADGFRSLQEKYKNIDMGSYPFTKNKNHGTKLVLRSLDYEDLEKAFDELKELCNKAKINKN